MGYDIYGLNPREMATKPKILGKDWTKLGKKQTDKYFEAMNKHQNENPGVYFRNNVWWWRPLWDYVCIICEDVMDSKDIEAGHSNSGYEIDEITIECMLIKLRIEIALGNHKVHEDIYTNHLNELPLEDCPYCNQTGKRQWPEGEADCNVCNTEDTRKKGIPIGKQKSWDCSYPFDAGNIEEFVVFLEQSGGIRIC
jgi:hypothetical protein